MKRLRRTLYILVLLAVVVFGVLTWLASSRLICPSRRTVQDYHRDILDHATEHGMRITPFKVQRMPCLMCEPVPNPGAAVKGRKLRAELEATSFGLEPWGTMKATLILLHGHTGCKEDHLPVAERFCAAGFRCLLPDLPGHGQNPAPYSCFGMNEATLPDDVLQAASRQFGFPAVPAAIFGISQGGAIALQAASQEGASWFAVAELSSFASLDRVVSHQADACFGVLAPLANRVVTHLVRRRAGFDPKDVRPVDAAAKLKMPVLIGHGDADVFVTPDQARLLLDAVPSAAKQWLPVPGAGHSNVLVTDAPVYATISRFFLSALRTAP